MKFAVLLAFIFLGINFAEAKRVALVIGNAKYVMPLNNSSNDATDIAESFRQIGFEVKEHHDLTLSGFRGAIKEVSDILEDDDLFVFFYAGHGIQASRINYLIPVDATIDAEEDLQYETFNVSTLFKMLETKRTKSNIIILDACRDNKFSRSVSRSQGGMGLAAMEPPVNTLIAFSTKAGETASDGIGKKNSPYTEVLLQFLKTPNIPVQTMLQQVRAGVMSNTSGAQIPTEYTLLTQNVFFNKTEGGNDPGPKPEEPTGPTSFLELKTALEGMLLGTPVVLRDRTVLTEQFELKNDCSFKIVKTYDFNSAQFAKCTTTGNLKNVNLNYTMQASSGESFPTFQNVSTSCAMNEWNFYTAKTFVFHVSPKQSKDAHTYLQKLKLMCK